jgi:hypothetical protein
MKKILTLVSSLLMITIVSSKAEIGIGVTAAAHMFDASGTETARESAELNSANHSETTIVPELFIEAIADNGATLGASYIPARELGSKSRTDTETTTGRESGTYTAKAEFENVFQIYTDLPVGSLMGLATHVKLGVQHATLTTLESLNSGSVYPDKDLLGLTLGGGFKGDLPYGNNMYYKAEATYTNFSGLKVTSDAGNTVTADIEDYAAKFSIGYKF